MSLSSELQSKDIVTCSDPCTQQELILERGQTWYTNHPHERNRIEHNLSLMGLESSTSMVDLVIENILLHYCEKLCGLCHTPQSFHSFLLGTTDCSAALPVLERARSRGEGVVLATGHFGAVEFIAPALAARGIDLSVVLRFTTPHFSQQVRARAEAMHRSGMFGRISFIEIGAPGTVAALEMASVVRSGGVLLSMFDEETPYSIPVTLLQRSLMGGAGLDKLIAFSRAELLVCPVFMIRMPGTAYVLDCTPLGNGESNPIQALYNRLEGHLATQPHQWYFLHEELPFAPTPSSTDDRRSAS